MDNEMTILYSSDNNYAQHMGVSIYSLLSHNRNDKKIMIYVIDNDISEDSKNKLKDIIDGFDNAEIVFLPFDAWKKKLRLNMSWHISISSYARLFVGEMLPEEVDRVLYIDCDMIVCDSLNELWNTNLEGTVLAAVQDSISAETKNAVGLKPETQYFNAGLLLINLKEWRHQMMGERCLAFIEKHNGNVIHHDQGVLNGILQGQFVRLSLNYNLMTLHYFLTRKAVISYFKEQGDFYSQTEIDVAKKKPIIIHYTPSFTSRPWCNDCKHPLKDMYWEVIKSTPWLNAKPVDSSDKWYVKLINWRYRNLPVI